MARTRTSKQDSKKKIAKPLSSIPIIADTRVEPPQLTPEQLADIREQEEKMKSMSRLADLKTRGGRLFQNASDARRKFDWEWLTRDLYRRGYQFSSYNPQNRTVVLANRSNIKVPINLTHSQMRIVRNQVTSFRPKWEVLPRSGSQEAITNARYSQKLLDYYYDKLDLRTKSKKVVTQGLTYSVGGPWQIAFDPEADHGNGEVVVWQLDTYDFYVDPLAQTLEDAEYCIKAVRKPLNEIKANPNYQFYDSVPQGTSQLAASEYKQFLLQALSPLVSTRLDEGEGEIVKELWVKERVTEKNSEEIIKELKNNKQPTDKLFNGEVLMRVVTFIDTLQMPLRVQLIRRSDFPFVIYQADLEPTTLYGESWIKHVIPPNRVLNALESSTFEYNYKVGKGRLAVPKNSGVRIVTNTHGEIVEYNPGSQPPTAIQIPILPNSYQTQIQNMRGYIEDIGGAHDVSMGKIPTGIRSGVGIAELKSADASNSSDLVDAMEIFLIKVAQKILNEIAVNYDVPRVIKALGKGGSPDLFAVIGEDGIKNRKNTKTVKIGADVFNIAVIGKDTELRVTIGSWLAYTKSAQYDKLKELYDSGIIDRKTFLENAEFSDVNNIIERANKEELLRKFRGTPAQESGPTDEEIAEQENIQMIQEGKTPEAIPEDNHEVHLAVHQEALGSMGNPLVEAHMQQHIDFIEQGVDTQADAFAGPAMGGVEEEVPPEGSPMEEPFVPGTVPQEQPPVSEEEMALLSSMEQLG